MGVKSGLKCPRCGRGELERVPSVPGAVSTKLVCPKCGYDEDRDYDYLRTFRAFRRVFDTAGNTIGWEDAKNGKRPVGSPDDTSVAEAVRFVCEVGRILEMRWLHALQHQVPAGVRQAS